MTNLNINAILDNSITENKLSSEIQGKLNTTVPTKISELENDLEFVVIDDSIMSLNSGSIDFRKYDENGNEITIDDSTPVMNSGCSTTFNITSNCKYIKYRGAWGDHLFTIIYNYDNFECHYNGNIIGRSDCSLIITDKGVVCGFVCNNVVYIKTANPDSCVSNGDTPIFTYSSNIINNLSLTEMTNGTQISPEAYLKMVTLLNLRYPFYINLTSTSVDAVFRTLIVTDFYHTFSFGTSFSFNCLDLQNKIIYGVGCKYENGYGVINNITKEDLCDGLTESQVQSMIDAAITTTLNTEV